MRFKIAFLLGFIFFVLGIVTLPGYGINWDTINHLPRGQAYLHYFLTGKKDFSDLPKYFDGWQKPGQWYWQDPDYLRVKTDLPNNSAPDRSLYQIDSMDLDYFLKSDGDGHPPLSDILSSFFNEILFRRLKLVNDIDSYRVYGLLLASITVGLVFYWASQIYGKVAGLAAAFILASYPLFWSESHFNTEKDIPETAYWTLFMFSFWKGITTKNWKWIILSGVLFGLALGTKLNIIFAAFVVAPWFFIYLFRSGGLLKNVKFFLKEKKVVLSLILIPVIGFGILILSWPHLWNDPIGGILKMIGFYKTIGTTNAVTSNILGLDTYAIKWIFYTTPVVTLLLLGVGLVAYAFSFKKDKEGTVLLFIFWLLIPIFRVVAPGSNIYGGVRQIMEYIPAMALVGAGGFYALTKYFNKKLSLVLVFVIFTPIILKIVSIHPNENVYFNHLIGGLKGAKSEAIPYWGFSFGSPYRQAASWLNKNVDSGASLVYTFDLIPNMPRIWLRTDINLYNALRSGFLRKGEYAMGLVYQGTDTRSYYDMYLEKFINPVYQIKVDDTAILKIWKNDEKYLRSEYTNEKKHTDVAFRKDLGILTFDLKSVVYLSHLDIVYGQKNCESLTGADVQTSIDGKIWITAPGRLPDDWRLPIIGEQPKNGKMVEPFVGQEARYIRFLLAPENTCLKNVLSADVYYFSK